MVNRKYFLISSVFMFRFYGLKEAENGNGNARNVNISVLGEKTVVQEPVVYENKLVTCRKRLLTCPFNLCVGSYDFFFLLIFKGG